MRLCLLGCSRLMLGTCALGLVGCGTTIDGTPLEDAGTRADGGAAAARLEVASEPNLTLVFDERAPLEAFYADPDGMPIAQATVRFALDGNAQDSTLTELAVETDGQGRAAAAVRAGSTAAAFRVRIHAEHALPVFVDVSVSDRGFGVLHADLEPYGGSRQLDEVAIDVFAGRTCDEDGLTPGEGDRATTVSPEAEGTRFVALPAGVAYALTAVGIGSYGDELAWDCVDGVELQRDAEVRAHLALEDEPLVIEGIYTAAVELETGATSAMLAEALQDATELTLTEHGGQAGLLLDSLEAQLRATGEEEAADSLAAQRASGQLDESLALELEAHEVGPGTVIRALADRIGAELVRISLAGRITADPTQERPFAWELREVQTAGTDSTAGLVMDAATFGVPIGAGMRTTPADDGGDWISLEALRIRLPLGRLVSVTLGAMAEQRRVPGLLELLIAGAGCPVLFEWSTGVSDIASSCGEECVQLACLGSVELLAGAIDRTILDLDLERSEVALQGTLRLGEHTGDLLVDRVNGEDLTGVWRGELGNEPDPVTGGLSAARASGLR